MGWLSNLFLKKQEEPGEEHRKEAVEETIEQPKSKLPEDYPMHTTNAVEFEGIDYEFINLLYFPNDEAKQKYLSTLQTIIDKLELHKAKDLVDMLARINNYVPDEEVDDDGEVIGEPGDFVPFLKEAVNIQDYIIIHNRSGKTERKRGHEHYGKDKVGYYLGINIAINNINTRIANNNFDFDADEALLNKALENDLKNYARLNALMDIASAFNRSGNITKKDEYYNRIMNTKFDLSEGTVSGFYKTISERYLSAGDKQSALKWLKAGVELNPKLGVKKQISALEKELA